MTSSATQTETDEGRGRRRAARRGRFDLAVGASVMLVGWLLILVYNHWHLTAPVVFLCLGWVAVVLCGIFFWSSAMAAAAEGTGPDTEGFTLTAGRIIELEREKRALLKAIKEIEFDRAMGKMSEADAAEITRVYRARAIDVLKELEGDLSEVSVSEEEAPLDQVIEREVRARMALAGVSPKRKPSAAQPAPVRPAPQAEPAAAPEAEAAAPEAEAAAPPEAAEPADRSTDDDRAGPDSPAIERREDV